MFNGMAEFETVFGEFVREEVKNYLIDFRICKIMFKALDNLDKNVMIYGVDYSNRKNW